MADLFTFYVGCSIVPIQSNMQGHQRQCKTAHIGVRRAESPDGCVLAQRDSVSLGSIFVLRAARQGLLDHSTLVRCAFLKVFRLV
jgi:hypothetical protein